MTTRHVGFTGTQVGCTDAQRAVLREVLTIEGCELVLHHGDCVGADATAHELAREMGARIELHPPSLSVKRAWCSMLPGETEHPKRDFLTRNRDIVDATETLVACPKEESTEELRSGTWATVRYARRLGRPIVIVRPSGYLERYLGRGR